MKSTNAKPKTRYARATTDITHRKHNKTHTHTHTHKSQNITTKHQHIFKNINKLGTNDLTCDSLWPGHAATKGHSTANPINYINN